MSTSAKRPDLSSFPTIFTDRSIGDKRAPKLLREAGLEVVTKKQCYGKARAETLADEVWLEMVGRNGWIAFGADKFADDPGRGILTDETKKTVIIDYGVRYFVLNSSQITFEEKANWFLNNIKSIAEACRSPGPFCYAVSKNSIKQHPLQAVSSKEGGDTSRLFS